LSIISFRGENRFLSNFYPSSIQLEDGVYSNVEAAFQSRKTDIPEEREEIRKLTNPVMAKRRGRKVTLRPNWDKVKLGIMYDFVLQKFTEHEDLKLKLLATGNEELVEMLRGRVTWNNHLGRILMKVRSELQTGEVK